MCDNKGSNTQQLLQKHAIKFAPIQIITWHNNVCLSKMLNKWCDVVNGFVILNGKNS